MSQDIENSGKISAPNSFKLLKNVLKFYENKKLLVRHFLDSIERASLVTSNFGDLRILNFSIAPENQSQLSEKSESRCRDKVQSEEIKSLIEYYSVIGKCHNIDVTDYMTENEDPVLFDQITCKIKKLINPRLVIHLGSSLNLSKAKNLASKLSFDFLDSKTFFNVNKIQNREMFSDFCFKFVMKEFSENLIIHVDQEFFEEQWQVFVYSLKFHLQSIIYTPSALSPKQMKFLKELPFGGERIELAANREEVESQFFKQYRNNLVVFDHEITSDLRDLVGKHNFHLFDCSLAFDVLSHAEEQNSEDENISQKGNEMGIILLGLLGLFIWI